MHRDKLESSTERTREKEGNGEETKEWSKRRAVFGRRTKENPTQTEEKCGVGVLKAKKVK